MYYTIGQRKGLGIGGIDKSQHGAWYVASKDISNNELIVVQGHRHPALYHTKLTASNIHWISGNPPTAKNIEEKVVIEGEKPCAIENLNDNMILVTFEEPCFTIAPGQSIVFYKNNICLGGALIESAKD